MTSRVIAVLGGLAAALAFFLVGKEVGNRGVDRAAETISGLILVLQDPKIGAVLSEQGRTTLSRTQEAIEEGDYRTATNILSSNMGDVVQEDCRPSGQTFSASAGALATHCGTGMTAAIASINSNGTIAVTIGNAQVSGSPGKAFADTLERYGDCYLIYLALEKGSDPLEARFSFDCEEAT